MDEDPVVDKVEGLWYSPLIGKVEDNGNVYSIGIGDANDNQGTEYDKLTKGINQKRPNIRFNLDGENYEWLFSNKYQNRRLKPFARWNVFAK